MLFGNAARIESAVVGPAYGRAVHVDARGVVCALIVGDALRRRWRRRRWDNATSHKRRACITSWTRTHWGMSHARAYRVYTTGIHAWISALSVNTSTVTRTVIVDRAFVVCAYSVTAGSMRSTRIGVARIIRFRRRF